MGCANHIMKEEGALGFYKGVGPRLTRVVLDVALTFAIFHSIKRKVTEVVAGRQNK
jgi:hypothetical protein